MMPIIKWAGSKRQLLPELKARVPSEYGRYVEPFLGSGALFFELLPQRAVLNDFNPELINTFCCIRDNAEQLYEMLLVYHGEYNALLNQKDRDDYYYNKRDEFNQRMQGDLGVLDASLFIFLNKTCYNGLYRVNGTGAFNTPSGKKKTFSLCTRNQLLRCSNALAGKEIMNVDFELACQDLQRGDFVYFDSPYYSTFDTYQPGGFPESEHIRLSKLFKQLAKEGVFCLLSNSNTDFIKKLYSDYTIDIVPVKRMINCDGQNRTGTEVVVKNY